MPAMRFDIPSPDLETQAFWDGCRDGRFLIRHCNACGADHFYPRPFCPKCWSPDVSWKEASGRGTLYTYSVVHVNDLPPFPERVPYVAAIVELAEGPRMMTNVVGCDPVEVAIGQEVAVRFEEDEDVWIPLFEPTGAGGADRKSVV